MPTPTTNENTETPAVKPSLLSRFRKTSTPIKVEINSEVAVNSSARTEALKPTSLKSVIFDVSDQGFEFFKLGAGRTVELAKVSHIQVERVESPAITSETASLLDAVGQTVQTTHINLIGSTHDPLDESVTLNDSVVLLGGYVTQGILSSGIHKGHMDLIVTWPNSGKGDNFKVNALYRAELNDPLVEELEGKEQVMEFNVTNQRVVTDKIPTLVKRLMHVTNTEDEQTETDKDILDIISNLKTSEKRTAEAETQTEEKKLDDVPDMND